MTQRRALCFGEALIDVFPDRRVVAGAPLHVAAHLASLGWEASLVTRVGNDEDGTAIKKTLTALGVGLELVETDQNLPTGTTDIKLTEDDHEFTVARPAAWDAIAGPGIVPAVAVICFGTLAMRDKRSRSALDRMLESSPARRVVDLNLRTPDYDRATVRRAIAAADVLKLSSDEWSAISKLLQIGPSPQALHKMGPEWVCVTKGSAGAELSHRDGGEWPAPTLPMEVVDSVGAGDSFCAGLIDGLMNDGDPQQALEQAAATAARTLGRRGGLPVPNSE